MRDILERLRDPLNHDPSDRFEGADEIERLRAECGEWVLKNAALHKEIARLRRILNTEQGRVMELCQALSDRDAGTVIKPKPIMEQFDD